MVLTIHWIRVFIFRVSVKEKLYLFNEIQKNARKSRCLNFKNKGVFRKKDDISVTSS